MNATVGEAVQDTASDMKKQEGGLRETLVKILDRQEVIVGFSASQAPFALSLSRSPAASAWFSILSSSAAASAAWNLNHISICLHLPPFAIFPSL